MTMGRLFFCFTALPLLVLGVVMLVSDVRDYVKTGNDNRAGRKLGLFWPVHLCFTLFMIFDFFIEDPVAVAEVLAMQVSCTVPMTLAVRWSDAASPLNKVSGGVFAVITVILFAWSLFQIMGHGRSDMIIGWKLYYCAVSAMSFASYMHCSVKDISALCKESCILLYARGLVMSSIFFMNLIVGMCVAMLESGIAPNLISCAFPLSSAVYFHIAYLKKDDLYMMKPVKSAVSSSISVSLLEFQSLSGGGSGQDEEKKQWDSELRDRFERYFEAEKPFLNPELSLNDAASALCTNKTYLSRMLNNGLGMNFSQVVNRYRVSYAMEAFVKNPDLKLADLSELSGFRSMSTFSLSFRINTGEAPGDWCRRAKNRLRLSSKQPVVIDG